VAPETDLFGHRLRPQQRAVQNDTQENCNTKPSTIFNFPSYNEKYSHAVMTNRADVTIRVRGPPSVSEPDQCL
jgi:hypothetical protein